MGKRSESEGQRRLVLKRRGDCVTKTLWVASTAEKENGASAPRAEIRERVEGRDEEGCRSKGRERERERYALLIKISACSRLKG